MTYPSSQPNPEFRPDPRSWADIPPAAPSAGSGSVPPPGGLWLPPGTQGTPPVPPATPYRRRHRANPAVAALLVAGAAAASIGAGHYLWPASSSAAASSAPSGTGSSGTGSPGTGNGASLPPSGSYGSDPFGGSGAGSPGGTSGGSSSAAGSPSDVSSIAAKVAPGLVDVNTTFGYQNASGAGTGIVLTSNGEVLTNNHVINGATSVSVTDIGNGRTYRATVVGYDRSADVAVLQLQGASGLQTASLATSSAVKVGQPVVAVGNAGGTGGQPSSAGGSVTALGQAITAGDELNGTSEQLSGLIQVNADIQPGDSGGPLVNTSGRVIGMDTAASSGYSLQSASSQGYAIPINAAMSIAHQIESGRSSSTVHVGPTAFLGVSISSGAAGPASGGLGFGSGGSGSGFGDGGSGSYGSGSTTPSGATVSGVMAGSAAANAGLAAGDTITSIAGRAVSGPDTLSTAIASDHPGDRVQIGWTDSSGQAHTATVTLGSGPSA